jgi:hypothetical protein
MCGDARDEPHGAALTIEGEDDGVQDDQGREGTEP